MKKYSILILSFAIVSTLLFSVACKRTDEEFLGTRYKAATENFAVYINPCPKKTTNMGGGCPDTTNAGDNFRFNAVPAEVMTVTAELSEEVTWTVKITGMKSGAVKSFTGTSSIIDNNTVQWDGGPSANTYRFFLAGEACRVTVSYLGTTRIDTSYLKIHFAPGTGPKAYNMKEYNGRWYSRIDDFDVPVGTSNPTQAEPLLRTTYADLADGTNNEIYVTRAINGVTPAEGVFMMRFKGYDVSNNTYLGGVGAELLNSHGTNWQPQNKYITSNDPTEVYFNAYIYGTGLTSTNLQIRSYEWDTLDANRIFEANYFVRSDITYNTDAQGWNDQWTYDLYVDWVGWKLVSIKYSDFKPSSNPLAGGNGNRIAEPLKITSWGLLLQSLPTSGSHVDAYVDQMYVTVGGPFIP